MTTQALSASANLHPNASADELARTEAKFRADTRRRRAVVILVRLAILVAVLGGWELGARTGLIDPFFFASPSGIADQIWIWITEGTSQGPLSEQIIVTLEETALGFLIGAVGGVICGILLGRNKFLADVFSIYIKIANSIPASYWARFSSSHLALVWRPRWRWPSLWCSSWCLPMHFRACVKRTAR